MRGTSFWRWAAEDPGYVAIIEPDGRTITAGELAARAHRVAHGLRALGLGRGDTVAAVLENGAAFLELYLAATEIGLYLVPINLHLAGPEIAYIVADCDARVVVASARTAEVCARAGVATRTVDEIAAGQPDALPDDRRAGAVMTYTSGTTG